MLLYFPHIYNIFLNQDKKSVELILPQLTVYIAHKIIYLHYLAIQGYSMTTVTVEQFHYHTTNTEEQAWVCCQMSFTLLQSSIMCIQDSRSLRAACSHTHSHTQNIPSYLPSLYQYAYPTLDLNHTY